MELCTAMRTINIPTEENVEGNPKTTMLKFPGRQRRRRESVGKC